MKKVLINEINDIRRIMGLTILNEGIKDEIYTLLKKLSSESTTEAEKNEIKSILKKSGITDEEIQRLARGGERELTSMTNKLQGNLTVELSDELDKILIKSGVAGEAFRNIGGGTGKRLMDSIESLYTAMKNKQIPFDDYLRRKTIILNAFSKQFDENEIKRAIRSMEENVDSAFEKAYKEGTESEKIILNIEDDVPIEDIRINNPSFESVEIPSTPVENPDDILLQIFSPDAVKKVKKEFKNYTPKEIKDQFDRWKTDKNLTKVQIEKWGNFMDKIDKSWWDRLSKTKKGLIITATLYGSNIVYMLFKIGLSSDILYLIPIIGPLLTPSEKQKQEKEKTEDIADYLKRLENYRVLSIDGKKLSDVDNFYLNKLINDFGTIQNDLINRITSKINSLVDSKKGTVDVYGMYQFGEEVSNEINEILSTVPETKNFKVEIIKETDPDYLKPGVQTTLKGLKNLLPTSTKKIYSTSREQNKPNNTTTLPANF